MGFPGSPVKLNRIIIYCVFLIYCGLDKYLMITAFPYIFFKLKHLSYIVAYFKILNVLNIREQEDSLAHLDPQALKGTE